MSDAPTRPTLSPVEHQVVRVVLRNDRIEADLKCQTTPCLSSAARLRSARDACGSDAAGHVATAQIPHVRKTALIGARRIGAAASAGIDSTTTARATRYVAEDARARIHERTSGRRAGLPTDRDTEPASEHSPERINLRSANHNVVRGTRDIHRGHNIRERRIVSDLIRRVEHLVAENRQRRWVAATVQNQSARQKHAVARTADNTALSNIAGGSTGREAKRDASERISISSLIAPADVLDPIRRSTDLSDERGIADGRRRVAGAGTAPRTATARHAGNIETDVRNQIGEPSRVNSDSAVWPTCSQSPKTSERWLEEKLAARLDDLWPARPDSRCVVHSHAPSVPSIASNVLSKPSDG